MMNDLAALVFFGLLMMLQCCCLFSSVLLKFSFEFDDTTGIAQRSYVDCCRNTSRITRTAMVCRLTHRNAQCTRYTDCRQRSTANTSLFYSSFVEIDGLLTDSGTHALGPFVLSLL